MPETVVQPPTSKITQARIIHERFYCNRGFAALAREASFVKQFRNLLTC